MILSILAPFVALLLLTVFYLFSPPDTLLSSYYCQLFCIDVVAIHVLSIYHQDVWKKHWDFLVYWISAIFLPIFTNRPRFWDSGSLVVSKQCHYAMVEADSHLKLLPPLILDISKVFECIGMLSIGIQ